jgi:hypothetical protein
VGQVGQVKTSSGNQAPSHQTYPIDPTHPTYRTWREFATVLAAAAILTIALTYPLAFRLGSIGRINTADGQFSIWNVAWVARTVVVDPLHVFDANIFYPHRGTLAYSEANLGAGALAIPAYWITRNPYAAHNSAVLIAFMLSAIGAYYLVRYLTADRRAAAVSAICYAFCPQVFSRTAEIQLLMTFGLPFTMLAFHRLADRPSIGRAIALGATMAATTYFCAYYGVFSLLMVGFAAVVTPAMRRRWWNGEYWMAIAIAAATASALILPLFEPYLALKEAMGFSRPLAGARQYAADWRSYFTSSAYAHLWIERVMREGKEVGFPGFVAVVFSVAGILAGSRAGARTREIVILYGTLGVLALWASFGPAAGLYTALYHTVPAFTLMRAPARFVLVFALSVSILAGLGVQALLARVRHATRVGALVALVAAAELAEVLPWKAVRPPSPAYQKLATLPRGPVIEMPYFWPQVGLYQHAEYMLNSTAHWMPLVNGYSDYIPPDFFDTVLTLRHFPSRETFKMLEPNRVRYAIFHRDHYNGSNWSDMLTRVEEFSPYLRSVYVDAPGTHREVRLYEIVGSPP